MKMKGKKMKKKFIHKRIILILTASLAINPCTVYASDMSAQDAEVILQDTEEIPTSQGDGVKEEEALTELAVSIDGPLQEYFASHSELNKEIVKGMLISTENGYGLTDVDLGFLKWNFPNLERLDVTGCQFDSRETSEAYENYYAVKEGFSYDYTGGAFPEEEGLPESGIKSGDAADYQQISRAEAYKAGNYRLELKGICPIDRGTSIDVGVAYETDAPKVEFQWKQYEVEADRWSTISGWQEGNWITWRPEKAGNYWLYVEARADGIPVKSQVCGYYYSGLWAELTGICVLDRGTRYDMGVAYKTNDPGVKFQWKVYELATEQWSMIQKPVSGNWTSWAPKKKGNYLVHVEAIDSRGNIMKTSTMGFQFKGLWSSLDGICTIDKGGQIDMGVAYGTNDAGIEFQWKVYSLREKKWRTIRKWAAGNWASWKPEGSGDYWLYVEAKTRDGQIKSQVMGYRINGAKITSFKVSPQSPNWVGSKIKLEGKSKDPIGEVGESRYLVYNGKAWKKLEQDGAGGAQWIPESTGNYLLCYEIYNKTGGLIEQSFQGYSIEKPYADITGIYLRQDGDMQYSMAASCQTNDREIQYRWQYYDVALGKWHEISGWSRSNAASWRAPKEGYFWIHVEARLHDGTETSHTMGYTVQRNLALVYANGILDQIGRDLYSAFNWSVSMPYRWTSADASPGSEWFAIYGFTNGYGDCYVMAGTFYYLARALGYDAHQIDGFVMTAGGGMEAHSWVEIVINGATYVFDPSFAQGHENGYYFTYGTSGTWRYTQYYRMN